MMKNFNLKIDGEKFGVDIESFSGDHAVVTVNGKRFNVSIERDITPKEDRDTEQTAWQAPVEKSPSPTVYKVKSPLPGHILGIKVREGQSVKEGQVVAVIEAMKMENDIEAERGGVVKSINVEKGDSVLEGTTLLIIE